MQSLPSGWEEARSGQYRMETKATIAGVEYNESDLFSVTTRASLFRDGTVGIGGCVAKELSMTVMPKGDIPRMAEICLYVRPLADGIETEWLPKGVYYIDTRDSDEVTGLMTINAYDAMLKGEVAYWVEGDQDEWPKPAADVVSEIAGLMGVPVDARSTIQNIPVEFPNDLTMREVLGYIAAAHGGNWTITDSGALRLVSLVGEAVAQISDGDIGSVSYLIDESGNVLSIGDTRLVVARNGVIDVGKNAYSLNVSAPLDGITGVKLWYDDDRAFFSGNESGRVLEADCLWATQAVANYVLSVVDGYAHQPFSASGALLDPTAELGDGVSVGGVVSIICEMNTIYDPLCTSDIGAAFDKEVDHEYPYLTRNEKEMRRKVSLGKSYYGTRITRANGLEITKTEADGTERSRVKLNSDVLAFYNDDGLEALYFDTASGKYRFRGDVQITGGTMNVNNNFIVDAQGNLTINGNIDLSNGKISWGGNYPSSGGISASEAANIASTVITNSLVASPMIAGATITGGKITSLEEMRAECDFYVGSNMSFGLDAQASSRIMFGSDSPWDSIGLIMSDAIGGILGGAGLYLAYNYSSPHIWCASDAVNFSGNVYFGNATVTGLNVVFG